MSSSISTEKLIKPSRGFIAFNKALLKTLVKSRKNNFGIENHDPHRYGPYRQPSGTFKENFLSWTIRILKYVKMASLYSGGLAHLYGKLAENDQKLLLDIIAYRIMGPEKIKLPLNNSSYWSQFEKLEQCTNEEDFIVNESFSRFRLKRINLNPLGFAIDLYYTEAEVINDFIVEQYAYKEFEDYLVVAEKDDIVLDLGGCYGDTALYFANKVGPNGKVYSFEFIPNNIAIHNTNTGLNPTLKGRIALVPNPVSNVSGVKIYYKDKGPGSKIQLRPFPDQTGVTETLSIDDFVKTNSIHKIDFIKMDIEGAEQPSLWGAENTIRQFKPKLAISVYHKMDDFVKIPKWILSLGLNYKLYLGHSKIHSEETVLFAKPH